MKNFSRLNFIKTAGALAIFPGELIPNLSETKNLHASSSQYLDNLIQQNQDLINNPNIINSNSLSYNLFAYDRPAGIINLENNGNFLELILNVQYPILNLEGDLLGWDGRYNYKLNAIFKNHDENTHIQLIENEKFIYKQEKKGVWKLKSYNGKRGSKNSLIETEFSGKPINNWIIDKFNEKEIKNIKSFFFGHRYIGNIPGKKIDSQLERVDINMKNFWLYEGGVKKSLYEDNGIIIGDISALIKKGVPILGSIELKPILTGIIPLKATNLELVLNS